MKNRGILAFLAVLENAQVSAKIWSAVTRAALCAARGTAFAHRPAAARRKSRTALLLSRLRATAWPQQERLTRDVRRATCGWSSTLRKPWRSWRFQNAEQCPPKNLCALCERKPERRKSQIPNLKSFVPFVFLSRLSSRNALMNFPAQVRVGKRGAESAEKPHESR